MQSEKIQTKSFRISCDNTRIQAQILKFQNISLLWINTYFPTDPQGHFDDTELRKVISDIEHLMDTEEFDHVLINGDINWHRARNNAFTRIIEEFVEKVGLCSIWDKFPVSHTHIHTDYKSFSTLDHFLLDPGLLGVVEEAEALHIGDNLSRHSPIMIKVRLESLPARPKHSAPAQRRRPAWYKATERQREEYQLLVEEKLRRLTRPHSLDCRDPACTTAGHSEDRDSFALDIMGAVIEASIETLPKTGGGRQDDSGKPVSCNSIPGWTETVEPRRQDALHWHAIWQSAGRPNKGALHSVMTSTRNKYHYAIRSVKRQEDAIRARRLWEANQSGPMDLIKEMKSVKANKVKKLPYTVEGKDSEEGGIQKGLL